MSDGTQKAHVHSLMHTLCWKSWTVIYTRGESKGNSTGVAITLSVQAIVVQYFIMQYDNYNMIYSTQNHPANWLHLSAHFLTKWLCSSEWLQSKERNTEYMPLLLKVCFLVVHRHSTVAKDLVLWNVCCVHS